MSTYRERRHQQQQAATLTTERCVTLLAQGVKQLEEILDTITEKDLKHFQGLSRTNSAFCHRASREILQLVTTAEGLRKLMAEAYSQGGLLPPFTDYNSRVNLAALSLREAAQETALLIRAYGEISGGVTEEALRLRLRVQNALESLVARADLALLRLNRVVEEAQCHYTTTATPEGLRLLGSGAHEEEEGRNG